MEAIEALITTRAIRRLTDQRVDIAYAEAPP